MKLDLDGKVVLVTGAENATGKAICKLLSEGGATVIAADADVTCRESCRNCVDKAVKDCGHIDALINNAVVETGAEARKPINEYDDALWTKVIATQLTGVFNMSKAASAAMVAAGKGGVIVNVGSSIGVTAIKNEIAYVAANAGMTNFTKAMALELGPMGIRVNMVAPGAVEGMDYIDGMVSHAARKRVSTPEEVAAMVGFLTDDAGMAVNGAVLTVDDAYSAGAARDF